MPIKDRKIAQMIMNGELLRIKAAAEMYSIPASTIRSWIMQGILQCYKLSPHSTFIYKAQLEEKLLFFSPRLSRRKAATQETFAFD